MKRLAIITTHPIQYNAPLFKMISERKKIEMKVFYTWSQVAMKEKYDPGFGMTVKWDIPLLEGYNYEFVENTAERPGSHHRTGIINPALNAKVEQWDPDAILIYGWNFVSHHSAMKFFHGKIPVLFRGDSTLLNERFGLKKMLRRLYLRRVYRSVDHALFAGSANKKYFQAHGMSEKKLSFMPHAVDNDRFYRAADSNNRLSNGVVFLFAGKFEPVKNIQHLIRSFKKCTSPTAQLILAGSGPLEAEMQNEAGGDHRIRFLPFQNQSEMPALYQSADVFVLPSVSETWGLAVNEAMAASCAVITSDKVGCAEDLVQNNKNGFVVPANDEAALTSAIQSFVSEELNIQKAKQTSEKIIANYSFKKAAEALESAVLNLTE